MNGIVYYQRNREVMLNRAKRYYHGNTEVLQEKAKNKYRKLSEKEKNISRENMGETDIIICLKNRNKD